MKIILSLIFVLGSQISFAKSFQTKITWCNGPVTKGDPSSCSSYGNWNNVLLKNLKRVTLPTSHTDGSEFSLEDSNGSVWSIDLKNCKTPLPHPQGCHHNFTQNSPDAFSISISEWQYHVDTRIYLSVEKNKTLSIQAPDRSHLIFELAEIEN